MAQLLVSAAHKSSGKTTVSVGLCAALHGCGVQVQPFKKGPDYIDPLWLGRAAGRPCHNLDFHTQSPDEIRATFARYAAGADLAVIEANKGLHDGMDLAGEDSNAALARLLQAPVVLVIDTRGMTRGVAPLVLGFAAFDPRVRIGGVILNQVGGSRHEGKLRAVLERYTDIPVLGALRRDPALHIDERHLGLIPSNEHADTARHIDLIRRRVMDQVDLDAVRSLAASAPAIVPPHVEPPAAGAGEPVRIGVLRDAAFGFYYAGDLDAFAACGAELVFIDSLHDARLPPVDGLFLGGGFPETHMEALAANRALMADIRRAIEAGLPAYAECGGLMYLARSLRWGDRRCEMAGVIPGDVVMGERPQGRGYTVLEETGHLPWPRLDAPEGPVHAHEFHYSRIENLAPDATFAWRVLRGAGVDGRHDGIVYRNLVAGYAHLRHTRQCPWVRRFTGFVRALRRTRSEPPSRQAGP